MVKFAAGAVGAFESVGAEKVALGLQEIGGQEFAAVAVVIGERRAERGDGDSQSHDLGHDPAQAERLRAIGWRTVAALSDACEPGALGCTHRLQDGEAVKLPG